MKTNPNRKPAMPLLPEDPAMRRIVVSQLIGFIGVPVVCIVSLLVYILLTR